MKKGAFLQTDGQIAPCHHTFFFKKRVVTLKEQITSPFYNKYTFYQSFNLHAKCDEFPSLAFKDIKKNRLGQPEWLIDGWTKTFLM